MKNATRFADSRYQSQNPCLQRQILAISFFPSHPPFLQTLLLAPKTCTTQKTGFVCMLPSLLPEPIIMQHTSFLRMILRTKLHRNPRNKINALEDFLGRSNFTLPLGVAEPEMGSSTEADIGAVPSLVGQNPPVRRNRQPPSRSPASGKPPPEWGAVRYEFRKPSQPPVRCRHFHALLPVAVSRPPGCTGDGRGARIRTRFRP